MSREDPQMKLRMPEVLRDRVAAASAANKRSMNAEIVARLEASFESEGAPEFGGQANADLRNFIDARLDEMENGNREQRLIFEQLLADAKKVLGTEFVEKSQELARQKKQGDPTP